MWLPCTRLARVAWQANLTPTEHTALEATCRAREVHMLAECGVKAALLEPDNGERLRLALATDDLKQLYESDDALRRERCEGARARASLRRACHPRGTPGHRSAHARLLCAH